MGCFLPPNRNKTPHIKQKTCIEPKHYIFLVQSGGSWKNKKGKREEKEEKKRRKNKEGRFWPATERESWERDGHNEARERERRRRRPMGHSVLAVGLAVTHGHHLWCRHSPALGYKSSKG
jgi:hypothetical protein